MEINTRDFGKIEIDSQQIITFKQPIFGFEEYTEYTLIFNEECENNFAWLQSIANSELCFILANPDLLKINYEVNLSDDVTKTLNLNSENVEMQCWLIMVANDDIKKSTVNLKSPLIINAKDKTALQTILESDYPIRYSLFKD